MQRGRDPVGIPNTVRVVRFAIRFDGKLGWNSRERRRHSNSRWIAWFRKQEAFRVQAFERVQHFALIDVNLTGNGGRIRNATRFRGELIDRELDLCIKIVGRHIANLAPFEILNSFLVFFSSGFGLECAEIATLVRLWIFLSRI